MITSIIFVCVNYPVEVLFSYALAPVVETSSKVATLSPETTNLIPNNDDTVRRPKVSNFRWKMFRIIPPHIRKSYKLAKAAFPIVEPYFKNHFVVLNSDRERLCVRYNLSNNPIGLKPGFQIPNQEEIFQLFKEFCSKIVIQRSLLNRKSDILEFDSNWNVSRHANGILNHFDFASEVHNNSQGVIEIKNLTSLECAVMNEIIDSSAECKLCIERIKHLTDEEKGLELMHLLIYDIIG